MLTLGALFITLGLYALLTASCLGWGRAVAQTIGVRAIGGFGETWLGWCGILFQLQLCHLLVPLNIYPSAAIYGTGLLLFALLFGSSDSSLPWKDGTKLGRVGWTGLGLFAIWVCLQAMKAPADYDSGLYHFNAIRWLNEYAIVPGLGNLHDRLAFNYAYFPFVASLNFYPWFNHGHNVAIGWLLLLTTSECLFSFRQVWQALQNKQRPSVGTIVPALLFPYLLYVSTKMGLSSPQPDSASFLVRLVLFIYLWRNLAAESKAEILSSTRFLLILGTTAVTLKLSNLFFAGSVCLVAMVNCYQAENVGPWSILKDLTAAIFCGVLILLTWLGRGIITSGYPLYPSTLMGFRLDWTIDPNSAKETANWVYSWARWPGKSPDLVLKDWSWLGPWSSRLWRSEKIEVILPVAFFLMASVFVVISSIKAASDRKAFSRFYLGFWPVLAGLVFWFYLAPDPRFAYGLFWLLPLAALCPYVVNLESIALQRRILIVLLALMFLPLFLGMQQMLKQDFRFSVDGWKPIKTMALAEEVTSHGLKVHVPVKTDQCWDSPLPSTPYFNPALELRGNGLQSGFKTLTRNQP